MVSQVEVLSDREKELLANYDSRLYGFLRQDDPVGDPSLPNLTHRSLLLKGVAFFEKELQTEGNAAHPAIFCKLGHLRLLTEDLPKALSAYQKFYNIPQVNYWKDAPFLYGLGLVYFHFATYQWAIKVFQQVLYLDPGFSCSNEVHLRLGIMFKAQNNYEASIKHFHMALMDSNPCSLSKTEIQFHLGHLFEMQNKCQQAQEIYEALIESPGLNNTVKANAYKQLGWMYYNKEHLGDRATRMQKAVQLLQKAIETDPNSGSSWYLIGRCYAMQGKVHDAFTSYRHAIDKSEANADTWCSIGVLYQQQNQPMDALQAYVCAIQLDPAHVAAWTDLGILYEACDQPSDAILCYSAARKYGATDSSIEARIKSLQTKLPFSKPVDSQKKNLPSVGEAWKLPIPAELTTRTIRNAQVWYQDTSKETKAVDPSLDSSSSSEPMQQLYLQQQQIKTAAEMEKNHVKLVHDVNSTALDDLEVVGMHQSQPITVQVTASQDFTLHNGNGLVHGPTPVVSSQQSAPVIIASSSGDIPMELQPSQMAGSQNGIPQSTSGVLTSINSDPMLSSSCISTGNRADTFSSAQVHADSSLLTVQSSANTGQAGLLTTSMDISSDSRKTVDTVASSNASSMQHQELLSVDPGLNNGPVSTLFDMCGSSAAPFPSPSYVTASFSTGVSYSPSLSQPLTVNPCSLSPTSNQPQLLSPSLMSPSVGLALASPSAKSPLLGGASGSTQVPKLCLLKDPSIIPSPPKAPYPPLPTDKLSPPTPSIWVENKRDAFSPVLQNLLLSPSNPITVVRGLAAALKLDLSLYSTKTLVETNADHQVEIRTQRQQAPDENWDAQGEKKVWLCGSSRSFTTIAKYAQYQANTFQESLKEEQEMHHRSIHSDSDSSSSSRSKKGSKTSKWKWIKFGTNVDLSDERKWKPQLQELTKLPPFARVVSPGNMLSHFGNTILGMNSVQLYMKIPGSRTPGHQENNNYCSININIGPGDCEWFATPYEYWGVIHNLCEKHGINYLTGSWWPVLEELYEERVPVYRFIQRPGDLVFINAGVVHWVQALGWCNNIAWNVGPLTETIFNIAIERYEWNKLQGEKSMVAMIHLAWNLARNIKITEKALYDHIKLILDRSYKYSLVTIENLNRGGIDVKWHGKVQNEAPHYCAQCEVEVFNLLFVTNNRKHLVYCQDCARKTSNTLQGFIVLNQYTLEELDETRKSFRLYKMSTSLDDRMATAHAQPPQTLTHPAASYMQQQAT
ncbi:lysine-specific demethylase 6A isoform X1 [Nematostella vectensis]|uniref:lysine-specific demethylase 6A isoform X1 n=1 Tax=Nematostella vectensis TaxID=45351 RepID=UPI0020776F35|nr:lysine-specific demethylase 6A isoform X1 [Nematostella vectensis]